MPEAFEPLAAVWLVLALLPFAAWVALDGFDFGAGIALPWLGHTEPERDEVVNAIGPYWDGNEVWLIAGGGTLFLAFPAVLGATFSGLYLPVMFFTWALMARGGALELRHHVHEPPWRELCDGVFRVASAAIPFLAAAAFTRVLLGVPLDGDGFFALALFAGEGQPGVLGVAPVLAGLLALAQVTAHGALFVAPRVSPPVRLRAVVVAQRALWLGAGVWVTLVVSLWGSELLRAPIGWACAGLAALGWVVAVLALRRGRLTVALAGCGAWLVLLLASGPASRFPVLVPSSSTSPSLTLANAAAPRASLAAGLPWWPLGVAIAAGWLVFILRTFRQRPASH